jgi:hypothetical protein
MIAEICIRILGNEAVKLNGSFWSKILSLCCRVCAEYGGRILVRNVPTLLPACQALQSWICKYASNYNGICLFVAGCILRMHCRQRDLLLTEKQGLDFQRGRRVYFSVCNEVQDGSGTHSVSCAMDIGMFSPGNKAVGAWYWILTMRRWGYFSTAPLSVQTMVSDKTKKLRRFRVKRLLFIRV